MLDHAQTRPLTAAERTHLERAARSAGGPLRRWRLAAVNALVVWAASLLLVFVLWLSVSWPARVMGGRDIGLQSPLAPWIVGIGVPLCTLYALYATVRWLRGHRDPRPGLLADLERGEAIEETHRFVAAKRFQEPEHGGLIYFLRTPDDRAFAVYDSASQDLGVQGKDPLTSPFRPRTALTVVRAPRSGLVLDTAFTGEALASGDAIELTASPDDWPQADAYSEIPWNDLERRLGYAGASAVGTGADAASARGPGGGGADGG